MRAYAVIENGKPLQPIELPTPEPRGSEVLLEVTHCGVCHSDIHIWDGYYDLGGGKVLTLKDRGVTLPLAMGHEVVGRVVKLGAEAAASGLKVGDLRLVFPWVGCGTCAKCRADEDNMCLKPRSLGVYQHGGYATHILVPEPRHLLAIGGLDPALAATYACSGLTVYSAIQKVMPLPPEEPVVLFGAGGLGLNAIAVLRALGHKRIVVVDIDAKKREAATAEGAADVVDGKAETPEEVAERVIAACGGPVEAVIDLVGASASARAGFASLRKGGKLILVGLYGGDLRLPLPLMPTRALTVRGSYVGNVKELRALIALAQSGSLPRIPITTEPLAKAGEALERLRAGQVIGRIVLATEGRF
jgi:alcohol dehydrogenase/propanol-preferring alcohol dehydrogenase